jgi:hypothetical protein
MAPEVQTPFSFVMWQQEPLYVSTEGMNVFLGESEAPVTGLNLRETSRRKTTGWLSPTFRYEEAFGVTASAAPSFDSLTKRQLMGCD